MVRISGMFCEIRAVSNNVSTNSFLSSWKTCVRVRRPLGPWDSTKDTVRHMLDCFLRNNGDLFSYRKLILGVFLV